MNCAKRQADRHRPFSGATSRILSTGFLRVWLPLALLAGCQHRFPVIGPVEQVPPLPVPYTQPASGTLAYGTVIRFAVDSLPTGTQLDYSTDNGQHWQTGDSLTLRTATTLQLRSRRGNYRSAVATVSFVVGFKRVLIIGNSITSHAPDPTLGWFGNWGMAASAPASDYVHLLTGRLQTLDAGVMVQTYSAVAFEQRFWDTDYSVFRPLAAFKPDLLVMRIAENVPADSVNSRNFNQYYGRLIDSLTVRYAPVKIVCTTSFFNQPATSAAIRQVAAGRNLYLADFNALVNNRAYQSYDRFKDPGVAAHPGDKGMQAIADLIWAQVH